MRHGDSLGKPLDAEIAWENGASQSSELGGGHPSSWERGRHHPGTSRYPSIETRSCEPKETVEALNGEPSSS